MYGKSNKPDYTREAKESESKTKTFFDVLGVKYGQLVKLNLILLVFMLPLLAWTWISFSAMAADNTTAIFQYIILYSAGLIPCLLIIAAPLAGVTYIIRNFTQDKHVWLWKDFVSNTKSNAKQALLYMLIYSVMIFIGQIILYSYTSIMGNNIIIMVLRGLFIMLYVFMILSAFYAFPMMVTYQLKLKHIIKNSLLLTIGSLHTTFLAPLIAIFPFVVLIFLSTVWQYGIIFLIFYTILFGFSFAMYITITFTTSVFAKHLSPSEGEETSQASESSEQ